MDQQVFSIIALGVAGIALYTDTRSGRIPNRLTFPTLAGGLVVHSALGGWSGLGLSAQGAGLGLALLLLPFLIGGMGAGDVKLLAALGSLLGPAAIFSVFVFSALLGGVIGAVILVRVHSWSGTLATVMGGWRALLSPDLRVTRLHSFPYASAIFFGVAATAALQWWG